MTESKEHTILYGIRDKVEEAGPNTQLTCAEAIILHAELSDCLIYELCGSLIDLLRDRGVELKGHDGLPLFFQYDGNWEIDDEQ